MSHNANNLVKAVFAGGCFWGMQDLIRKFSGVVNTRVGYTGGTTKDASYADVKMGTTGHAESIEIEFNPKVISYRRLLEVFFQIHDPSTEGRQGNDHGNQYRSEIFYVDAAQKNEAEKIIQEIDASGLWPGKIVTAVSRVGDFWEAEPEHQDYLERYPAGYSCHFPRSDWKLPA